MRKTLALFLAFCLISPLTLSSSFGDMERVGTDLKVKEGSGEWISKIYNFEDGNAPDYIEIEVKNLSGKANLFFEVSKNNFETVEFKKNFELKEDKEKYYISKNFKSNYARLIVRVEGSARLKVPELRTKKVGFPLSYHLGLAFIVFVGFVIGGYGYQKSKQESKEE